MKWYFASRTRHQEKLKSVSEFLDRCGQAVLSHWVHVNVDTAYSENLEETQALSKEIVHSLLETDIFVLISDPEGTDMFVELGVALGRKAQGADVRIYIVGEHSKRSLMQLHPSIVHVDTLSELFEREGIAHEDFSFPVFE